MRFISLEIQNFLSISEAKLDFTPGVHMISGINLDMADESESNGAGKSSIFDALYWVVFNKNPRGAKKSDVVNKIVGKDCYVAIEYEHEGHTYRIERYRDHTSKGNSALFIVDGQDKSSHTSSENDAQILNAFPIPTKVFDFAVMVGQGMPNRFMSLTETAKRDLLMEIVDLSIYDIAEENLKSSLRCIQEACTVATTKVDMLDRQVSEAEQQKILSEKSLQSLRESTGFDREVVENQIKTLEIEFEDISGKTTQTQDIVHNYEKSVQELSTEKQKRESSTERYELGNQINHLRTVIDLSNKELYRMSNVDTTSPCPICKQSVSTDHLKQHFENLSKDTQEKVENLNQLSQQLDAFDMQTAELSKRLHQEQSDLDTFRRAVSDLYQRSQTTSTKLSSLRAALVQDTDRRAPIEAQLRSWCDRVEQLSAQLLEAQKEQESKRFEETHFQYWKESLPKLKAAAIGQVLSFLNTQVTQYMDILSEGTISVHLYQEAYGKNSKIKVDIKTAAGLYELSSGGEKRRVDLAIYLALSDLVEAASGIACNLIVCDEITDNLSVGGTVRFLKALQQKAVEGRGVYVITHNTGVEQYYEFSSKLCVEKSGGLSTLKVA